MEALKNDGITASGCPDEGIVYAHPENAVISADNVMERRAQGAP